MPVMCSWIFLILSSLTIQVCLRVCLPLAHTQCCAEQSSDLPIEVQEAFVENCNRVCAYRGHLECCPVIMWFMTMSAPPLTR